MRKGIWIVWLIWVSPVRAQPVQKDWGNELRPAVYALTMVMVHDVVNPPAAARYYAYALLGAYDIVAQQDSSVPGPWTFIKGYPNMPVSGNPKEADYRVAAIYCILETGRQLLPSGFMLKEKEEKFILALKKNKMPAVRIDRSVSMAAEVAARIVAWSKTDNYSKLSARLRYTPLKGERYWYPTPPAYIEAVEPHWKTIRPMVIDSCDQFRPLPPVPFSKDTGSAFYKLAREVYEVSKNPEQEQLNIAAFWDCNPFAVASQGHMMIGFKKMSPGGHWMDIAGIVAAKAGLDLDHAVLLHALVSITLMDAFISCWDEKYRSHRIRPETYIGRYIDVKWQPLLQTPPFPEYTSGHSVISAASAEMLTYLLGDGFSYTDNAEELFDIRPRSFHSFREAAAEAAISRLYGGIHYRDAIVNGQAEGRSLGQKIVARVKAAGILPLRGDNTALK